MSRAGTPAPVTPPPVFAALAAGRNIPVAPANIAPIPVQVNPHAPGPMPANPDIDTIAEEKSSPQAAPAPAKKAPAKKAPDPAAPLGGELEVKRGMAKHAKKVNQPVKLPDGTYVVKMRKKGKKGYETRRFKTLKDFEKAQSGAQFAVPKKRKGRKPANTGRYQVTVNGET